MKDAIKKWLEKDGERFIKDIGIKKGQTVLDFGSGEGHYTIPVARVVGEKGKAYALDKDRNELKKLKKVIQQGNIKNIDVINEDSKIPLERESYY